LNRAGHDAGIAEGEKSQFDVVANGETVFSKRRAGRFPDEGEVLALVS
jgi:hypothetical protein